MLIDAYSGLPSTSRSGAIDIDRVIKAIKAKDISIRDIEQVLDSRGGLLSLVGTNNFYAMIGFLRQGATPVQRKKIELVQNFLARKIAGFSLRSTHDRLQCSCFLQPFACSVENLFFRWETRKNFLL